MPASSATNVGEWTAVLSLSGQNGERDQEYQAGGEGFFHRVLHGMESDLC